MKTRYKTSSVGAREHGPPGGIKSRLHSNLGMDLNTTFSTFGTAGRTMSVPLRGNFALTLASAA